MCACADLNRVCGSPPGVGGQNANDPPPLRSVHVFFSVLIVYNLISIAFALKKQHCLTQGLIQLLICGLAEHDNE